MVNVGKLAMKEGKSQTETVHCSGAIQRSRRHSPLTQEMGAKIHDTREDVFCSQNVLVTGLHALPIPNFNPSIPFYPRKL